MSSIPLVRRRPAGTVVALLVALLLPWPRGLGAGVLAQRLVAAWHGVFAAQEAPPPPADPVPDPKLDPRDRGDKGPSLDPDGSGVSEDESSAGPSTSP